MHDTDDTIVAVATAPSGAPRGAVRLSGPDALEITARLIGRAVETNSPSLLNRQALRLPIGGVLRELPCDAFVWPDERSYTRQPTVELHTVGSPPLLRAIVAACVDAGARLAEPGEFTLRAFLAGRLDLTQAEAVLAVIDARHTETLDAALAQLAGGLSGPLHRVRDDLLGLLADLEAGLDFVEEEDVRFVEREELVARITQACRVVVDAENQLTDRADATRRPRVAIVGPPNVGKSSLFNALVARFGDGEAHAEALVADRPGVTRDALVAPVRLDGVVCELVDTAGDDDHPLDAIDQAAREGLAAIRADADLVLECRPLRDGAPTAPPDDSTITVGTMADLAEALVAERDRVATSTVTGEGVATLAASIARQLAEIEPASGTASRCRASLADARAYLHRAGETAASGSGDELVALELREALDAVGRVVGAVVTDDVLDQIFSRFCIGK